VDAQSVFIVIVINLSDLVFPIIRAFVFAARVPILVIVGVELVAMVVVIGFVGHGNAPKLNGCQSL
jgi:hypothetical protein